MAESRPGLLKRTWLRRTAICAVVVAAVGLVNDSLGLFDRFFVDGPAVVEAPESPPDCPPLAGSEPPNGPASELGDGALPDEPRPKIRLRARDEVSRCWSEEAATRDPGDTIEFLIEYANTTGARQEDVVVGINPSIGSDLVPGSTLLKNSSNPNGVKISSHNIFAGGINIGNYEPGANAWVRYDATVPTEAILECGWTELNPVVVTRADGTGDYWHHPSLHVKRDC